ncbi:S8 family serine peptidase [Flavobacterium sp. NG2]|uniref:S8 family serine peptidase n=1 Tax=Flavobacterium sp. NG2 TaxID=3097547 RepID=UPI002A7EBD83|nr:S8 family serine peptidase [Flavobacterium sp. NG2]WPR70419.1 S8 family serine peptidase [Flavobacterium sp. NG2]
MKNVLCLLSFFICFAVSAQEEAWVYFNAKANEQSYYDAPLTMLSQRALDRRIAQKINIDFKDVPINPSYISEIKKTEGFTVMAKSKWLNAIHLRGDVTAIRSLKTHSFVDKIVFANKSLNLSNKTVKTAKVAVTDKTKNTRVNFAYGVSENQIKMLNGDVLHQQNYTGSGKIIAVLDSGFPGVNTVAPFARIRDANKILGGYNFVAHSTDFYKGGTHGTYVLSSMAGYKENVLVGTAPDASYYLFVTEDDVDENPVEESYWVEAAEKADSLGVDIITTSLGYFKDHTNPAYDYSYSDMSGDATFVSKGANIAFSKGMMVIASGGNEGTTSEPHIGSPADAFSVLAVGAVTSTGVRASFSSIGPSYDGRVKPDVMAQGQSAVLSDEKGNIVTASGTSFSGPIIAGMVACLWQAFPNKTNQEIKDMVIRSSSKYTSPTNEFGYGIPNFSLALGIVFPEIEDFSESVKVYPNPTPNFIRVDFPESFKNGRVLFYSAFGKKVLEQNNIVPIEPISLESLTSGIYFYTLEFNTFSKTGKIIKL